MSDGETHVFAALNTTPTVRELDRAYGSEDWDVTYDEEQPSRATYSSDFNVTMGETSYSEASETITITTVGAQRAGQLLSEKCLSPAMPEMVGVFDFYSAVDESGEDNDVMSFLLMQLQLDLTIKIMLTRALQDTDLNPNRDELAEQAASTAQDTLDKFRALINVYRIYGLIRQSLNFKNMGANIYSNSSNAALTAEFTYVQEQLSHWYDLDSYSHEQSQPASLGHAFVGESSDTESSSSPSFSLWFSQDEYLAASNTKLFKQLVGDLYRFVAVGSFDLFPDEEFISSRRESSANAWTLLDNTGTDLDDLIAGIDSLESAISRQSWGGRYGTSSASTVIGDIAVGALEDGIVSGFSSETSTWSSGIDSEIEELFSLLPSDYYTMIKVIGHLVNRDFAISNNAPDQFNELIDSLSSIDDSVTSGTSATITLDEALKRALGTIQPEEMVYWADNQYKASLSSIVSAPTLRSTTDDDDHPDQVLFFETYPLTGDETYYLGSDHFLQELIDNGSADKFSSFADTFNNKIRYVIRFLENFLNLGDEKWSSESEISTYPLGTNSPASAAGLGQLPSIFALIAKNLSNWMDDNNGIAALVASDSSKLTYSSSTPWREWIIYAIFSIAGEDASVLQALCTYMAVLSTHVLPRAGETPASPAPTGNSYEDAAIELTKAVADATYRYGASSLDPDLDVTGLLQNTKESSTGDLTVDETGIFWAIWQSSSWAQGLMHMIAILDYDFKYGTWGDDLESIGMLYTHPHATQQAGNESVDDINGVGWRTSYRGWSAATRAALNTMIISSMFSRYLSVSSASSDVDVSGWPASWEVVEEEDTDAGWATSVASMFDSSSSTATFSALISPTKLATFWCAMQNLSHMSNFNDAHEDLVDQTAYSVSKTPKGGSGTDDFYDYIDTSTGTDTAGYSVMYDEIEGLVLGPLLKEMNYIRDMLRFLDGFSQVVTTAALTLLTVDIDKLIEDFTDEESDALKGLYAEPLATTAVQLYDMFATSPAYLGTSAVGGGLDLDAGGGGSDPNYLSALLFPNLSIIQEGELYGMIAMLGTDDLVGSSDPDDFLNPQKRIVAVGLPIGMMTYLRDLQSACSLESAVYDTDTTIKITLHLMNLATHDDSAFDIEYLFDTSAFFHRHNDTQDVSLDVLGDGTDLTGTHEGSTSGHIYLSNLGAYTDDWGERADWDEFIEEHSNVVVAKIPPTDEEIEFPYYNYDDFISTSTQVLQGDLSETTLSAAELSEIYTNTTKSHMLKAYLKLMCGIDLFETSINFNQDDASLNDLRLGGSLTNTQTHISNIGLDSSTLTSHYQEFIGNLFDSLTIDKVDNDTIVRLQREALRSSLFSSGKNSMKILNPNVFERIFCFVVDISTEALKAAGYTGIEGTDPNSKFLTLYTSIELLVD